ncbi:hypothetical protein Geob_2240 [Geotalea daltonii FRC-32]|uniref:Uncharacterized protein n=1 Tax=Geotalea daltonii (strain DSM 22248 / JCM 15807 / FRC-32) TaxID=316067 RepID=B9M9M2_GEODF|nr:DUF6178 family protein [Geotalea daltonii]ACM20594.1 hypothetical protein Geob_2240 [Geotalea daltonii FRC-32]
MQKKNNEAAILKLVKGGRASSLTFAGLPFVEKARYLKRLGAKERMDLIIGDAEGERLVREMEPQEFFWMVKDVGETDALDLVQLASPEQCLFLLDMELWSKWSFSHDKAVEWYGYLLEGGDDKFRELLPSMDFELLQLFLNREIIVGGGIGDMSNDEERLADWDHTFDGTFMITFKNPKHSQVLGRFIESIRRIDEQLYVALMEGVKSDVDLELEDICYQFRSGRLADLGFPPLDEALSFYARVKPSSFSLHGDKKQIAIGSTAALPVPVSADNALLQRALALADSEELYMELNYLINNALVADGTALADTEVMHMVVTRVYGYLNMALETICGDDAKKAGEVLTGEFLKRLFQLGYSIILDLKTRAEGVTIEDYAANKLLNGLKNKRPRFYRGLDADTADGYREFRSMADVAKVDAFLRRMGV